MLDSMPGIAAAKKPNELWAALWNTVRKRTPQTVVMQIFQGEEAIVREVWTSRHASPGMRLILRGWGPDFGRMMQEQANAKAFLSMFGATRQEAQARLERFLTGRGNPLLLNDPDAQLSVFLSDEELQKIREARPDGRAPGQVMLCPIMDGDRISLVAALSAEPGKQPFSWEDAADVWQLVQLAHEVSTRIEVEETVLRHFEEVKTLRATMRRISVASDVVGLVREVGRVAQTMLRAESALIMGPVDREQHRVALLWQEGIEDGSARSLGMELVRLFRRPDRPPGLMIIESVGGSEPFGASELRLETMEALVAVPLEVHGDLFGVLALLWPQPRRIRADERGSLEFLGAELSLAMDHRRLFHELAAAHAELRKIVSAVDEGILSLDIRGRLRYCNPRAAELLAISDRTMEGAPLLDLLPEYERHAIAPLLASVLSGQTVGSASLDLESGSIRVSVSFLDADGTMTGSVWTFKDVDTPGVHGMLVDTVLRHVSEALLVLDRKGHVVEANDAARRFFGSELLPPIDGGELAGYRWGEELDDAFFAQLLREGSLERSGRAVGPNGRSISYDATFWRLDRGDDVHVLTTIRDLTSEDERIRIAKERRNAHQLAKRARRLAEALEVGLSEQRDLVTSLLTQCELALKKKTDGDRLLAAIETVQAAARRGGVGLARCGDVLKDLTGVVAKEIRAMEEVSGVGTRQVWIVSDRPQRREHLMDVMVEEGFQVMTVEKEELDVVAETAGLPDLVLVDLVSLNGIEGIYNRVRRISLALPVVIISAIGTLEGSAEIAEDPRLRVIKSLPAGSNLMPFLAEVLQE